MNESAPLNMSVETGQPPGLPRISPYTSIGACFVLSVIYVASLYIWNSKHNRDHPVTIKRRFCSVSVVMLFAPLFVYLFSSQQLLDSTPFTDILGLRLAGLWQAIVVPMLLTMLLFLGPLCVQLQNETMKVLLDLSYIKGTVTSLLWIRNHIMAPLSEEFVFRACMMPLILQSFSPVAAVFITPLFFGTAHVHHIAERLSLGVELKTAIFISCFQFVYTTLFGFYSSFLFARTGHFIAPFLVHAFCNHMGFPDIQDLWQQHIGRRIILGLCYVLGLVGWIFLLPYATQPDFYLNQLYWNL